MTASCTSVFGALRVWYAWSAGQSRALYSHFSTSVAFDAEPLNSRRVQSSMARTAFAIAPLPSPLAPLRLSATRTTSSKVAA